MKPLLVCLCVALSTVCVAAANENSTTSSSSSQLSRKDVSEEMASINKSLEGLLSELATIKREASGRLGQVVKNRLATTTSVVDPERIRQQKVSRFVLKRVAELESESLGMRDEMVKLFELQKKTFQVSGRLAAGQQQSKQEDVEFDNEPAASSPASPATTTSMSSAPAAATTTTTTTTAATTTEAEAAQIGFDLEQLKRLGEEIGKRLDAFGKEAAKNLGDLMEGIKLVFREPPKSTPAPSN